MRYSEIPTDTTKDKLYFMEYTDNNVHNLMDDSSGDVLLNSSGSDYGGAPLSRSLHRTPPNATCRRHRRHTHQHHHHHFCSQQQQHQQQQNHIYLSRCKRHGSLYAKTTKDHQHFNYADCNVNNGDDYNSAYSNDADIENVIDSCNKSLVKKSDIINAPSTPPIKSTSNAVSSILSSASSSSYNNTENENKLTLSPKAKQLSNFYVGLRHMPRYLNISSNCSINGTANGAATIAYVRQRQDSRKNCKLDLDLNALGDGDNWGLRARQQHSSSKTLSVKGAKRKNSIGCLNAFYNSSESPKYYHGISSTKSHSLPGHSSNSNNTSNSNSNIDASQTLNCNILNALRVPAAELANQLTLLDYNIFTYIQPDELTSCAWTKKDKHIITPNIVAFTKRFNHTSFWTVQEILMGEQPKQRAEILSHFIKVAKKLHELNNLHSLFAIISALQSASIYRLKKTWSCLSKKDRSCCGRLSDIFSDQNNWENLRSYMESLRLPCIPYLGLFLTDLIYIDLAYPHKGGGLEPEQRRNRMNNILRVITNYQQSNYMYITANERVQKYLNSIRYIEELQNIFEEEQYKKSLKLEPSSSLVSTSSAMIPSSSLCSSKESCHYINMMMMASALACLNLSPAKTLGPARIRPHKTTSTNKFIPGHRKCHSLGTNVFEETTNKTNKENEQHEHQADCHQHEQQQQQLQENALNQKQPQLSRHLLDDSLLEMSLHRSHSYSHSNGTPPLHNESAQFNSSDSNDGAVCDVIGNNSISCASTSVYTTTSTYTTSISNALNHILLKDETKNLQGCIRRKTVQKGGRKPAVASWQRYWLEIWSNSLVYFPPKSFKGTARQDFKREPCKVCHLEDGWYAQSIESSKDRNCFELYHRTLGTVYKFRTDSPQETQLWISIICKVANQQKTRTIVNQPINLMSFE